MIHAPTKGELEKAEAERVHLVEQLSKDIAKVDKVTTLLPRAMERYQTLLENLGTIPPQHVAQARAQIGELVGQIRLVPRADGHLEARLAVPYEGRILKLVVGS
jgi:ribosomal protein L17